MKSIQQLIGQRFGRLVVLEHAGKDKKRNVLWKCKCDCGKETIVRGSGLLCATTKSCGCLVSENGREKIKLAAQANRTHGMSRTPTWVSWSMMMQRCFNPKRRQFKDWGGRGIRPCKFIAESPANLIAIVGERPEGLSIDRINNNGGYTCGQCEECKSNGWPMNLQWSDSLQQNKNKRSVLLITKDGLTMTRREWMQHLGVTYGWVRSNLKQYEHPN